VVVDGTDHQLAAYRGRAHSKYSERARMKSLKWPALVVGFALLMLGTVMVFMAFDRNSHSNSDTIRPFVITMAPVWAVAIAAAIVLLRPPQD